MGSKPKTEKSSEAENIVFSQRSYNPNFINGKLNSRAKSSFVASNSRNFKQNHRMKINLIHGEQTK